MDYDKCILLMGDDTYMESENEYMVEIYQNDKLIYKGTDKYIKVENNFPPLVRQFSRENIELPY